MVKILKILLKINNLFLILSGIKPFPPDEIQEIKNIKFSKPCLKVIKDPEETIRTAINLVQSAENEVLLLFSSANGFYRRMVLGDGFLTL
jgi:hypothetical protein